MKRCFALPVIRVEGYNPPHFRAWLLILVFLFCPSLFSMEWPSTSGIITGNFGWNDNGAPRLGATFTAEGSVAASENGEFIYYRRDGDTASRLPSPLGAWAALDHGDGIISIYGRFDSASCTFLSDFAEKGSLLAGAGISGWSESGGFYFQLFDRKERRWINPAMIIAPPEDTRPPVITGVGLMDSQGRFFDLSQTRNLSQGAYHVFVETFDTRLNQNESPLAPYKIICSLNGSEAGLLAFETYFAREGVLSVYMNRAVPVREVYGRGQSYRAAEIRLTRGQSTLEIISQDISGNSRSAVYRLAVE